MIKQIMQILQYKKRVAEPLCALYYKRYDLEAMIMRPRHTYDPLMTDKDNCANVQFIRNVMVGQDFILKSLGTQLRSYCYLAECASIILTSLIKGKSGEAYNIVNSNAKVTISELAEFVAIAAGGIIFESTDDKAMADETSVTKQVLDVKKLENLE